MTQHASLGASSSHRWINCPGSNALIDTLPEGTGGPSEHAMEGTAAHALGELALRKGTDTHIYEGTVIKDFEVDEEMADAVGVYVDYCREILRKPGGGRVSWVERRVSLASLNPPAPMFGTTDFMAYNDIEQAVDIVDLKYGRGVVVEVVDNPQLYYYALGAVLEIQKEHPDFPIKKVRMTIAQPRVEHKDGVVRTIEIDYEDLLEFALDLLASARAAIESDAPRHPGSWCRWCPAAAVCPEKAEESVAVAQTEFGAVDVDPPHPASLTVEQLQWVLSKLPLLEEWASQVRQFATEVLEAGGTVPGFKLVNKRAYRKWVGEADVLLWADEQGVSDDDLYEKKLNSPNKLEKKIGKANLPTHLVKKESSGVTLAPEWDKRPAVTKGNEFPLLPNPNSSSEEA